MPPHEADTVFLPAVPAESIAYAHLQTPPTGLRKFDLGTIPASVTPPRTWRRAAVFAVATSVAVVVGLTFAAVALVGAPHEAAQIDALPGYPTQPLLLTELPNNESGDLNANVPTSQPVTTSSAPSRTGSIGAPTRPVRPSAAATGTQSSPTGPSAPDDAQPSPTGSPTRTTVESAAVRPPPTSPETMGDRTELYFKQVTQNPAAAYAMTTGSMRSEGQHGIEQRYGDIERIEVEKITIDPNWSTTRSVLTVVRKDGTTTTEVRELTFSYGADPKISSDGTSG